MIYCLVCAGSYGVEEAVQYGGPFISLMVLLVVVLLTGLPQSLIYSELSTMFPQTGSTIIWPLDIVHGLQKAYRAESGRQHIIVHQVRLARFFARLSSNMLFCNAIVDNAVTPTMVSDYLVLLAPQLDAWYYRFLIGLTCFTIIFVLNLYGISAVGWSLYVLTVITVTPIFLFICFSFPEWDLARLSPSNKPTSNFSLNVVISNMVWQFAGLEQITNVCGDVKNPHITYPISYIVCIILVILTYAFTIIGGVMVENDFDNWVTGALGDTSTKLPGCSNGWLKYWLIIGGGTCGLSIANSCVSCSSRELYTNAHCKLLPFGKWVDQLKSFRKQKATKDEHGTPEKTAQNTLDNAIDLIDEDEMDQMNLVPHVATAICCFVPALITMLPFTLVVEIDAFIIAANTIMQICFYFYAKFGKYGYQKRHPEIATMFTLKIKAPVMAFIAVFPLIVYCFLICNSEWYSAVCVTGLQITLFGLRGIEILVSRKKKYSHDTLYSQALQ